MSLWNPYMISTHSSLLSFSAIRNTVTILEEDSARSRQPTDFVFLCLFAGKIIHNMTDIEPIFIKK